MAEMHAEATPFLRAMERETLAPLTGKIWHFLHCDTSHLQIDALSEIDRRRYNECASVTQRHATRTLWDLSSGACWLVCFLKHRGPAVGYVIQIEMGSRKCVSIYCSGIIVWTKASISKTALYAILVNQTTLKSIFHDTAWISLYIQLKFGQKIKMIVILFSIHAVIPTYQRNHLSFMWNLSLVGDHVTVCVAYK